MIAASLAMLLGGVAQPTAGTGLPNPEFDHAARCRVHTELLLAVFYETPKRKAWGQKIFAYWVKRSDKLGLRAGFTEEALPTRYWLIPVTSDMDFINGCIDKARKDGLKP